MHTLFPKQSTSPKGAAEVPLDATEAFSVKGVTPVMPW